MQKSKEQEMANHHPNEILSLALCVCLSDFTGTWFDACVCIRPRFFLFPWNLEYLCGACNINDRHPQWKNWETLHQIKGERKRFSQIKWAFSADERIHPLKRECQRFSQMKWTHSMPDEEGMLLDAWNTVFHASLHLLFAASYLTPLVWGNKNPLMNCLFFESCCWFLNRSSTTCCVHTSVSVELSDRTCSEWRRCFWMWRENFSREKECFLFSGPFTDGIACPF